MQKGIMKENEWKDGEWIPLSEANEKPRRGANDACEENCAQRTQMEIESKWI